MHSTTIAVDLAKSVFEVAVSRHPGQVSERHRLSRGQFSRFLRERTPATLVMEACGTAHFWGREAEARGHQVVLLPPHAVRPYVLRNKTDGADAKGLLEALRNEAIRPVPVKSVEQHLLGGLHRLRSAWMATRTARLNTLRGLLRELGIAIPVGARQVVPHVWGLVSDAESEVPEALRPMLAEAAREIAELEVRVRGVERQLEGLARGSAVVTRLRTIPGVGLLTATALVAFVGDVARFPSGRHLASYLGLTPRESSSGLQRHLGRISKRGDPYLRMLLIHGARSVLCHAKRAAGECDRLRAWALERQQARGHNKAAARSPTNWRASPGPSGATSAPTQSRRRRPSIDPPTEDCFEHTAVTAHRSGPARGDADNKPGPSRPLSAIGTPRAAFHHGPEPSAPRTEAGDTTAVRSRAPDLSSARASGKEKKENEESACGWSPDTAC